MTELKCLGVKRRCRPVWIICFIVAVSISAVGFVRADDTRLDDSAKKAGNNFGELLKGMGQELKKAGGTLTNSGKKDGTKKKKPPEHESEKDQDKPPK